MTSRERVRSALARRGYDRLPVRYEGTPEITAQLCAHFGIASVSELQTILGDDTRGVGPAYVGPPLRTFEDGSWEGQWGERYALVSFGGGSYPEAVSLPYADVTDVAALDGMPHPRVEDHDCRVIPGQCAAHPDHALIVGHPGCPDFMNGIARYRGVEQVLLDLATDDPVFLALMQQRFEFYYGLMERALQAGAGRIDILHCGEDLGCQQGVLISPRTFDAHFAPKYRAMFALGHRYGAQTMLHSCGSVRAFIPRLIDLGLDILDVVQVAAAGMDLAGLHRDFGRDLSFCGTVCVQTTLPFGTVDEVRREVALRRELFADGGLLLAPTHAIQVGTPLENVLAMYREAGSLVD